MQFYLGTKSNSIFQKSYIYNDKHVYLAAANGEVLSGCRINLPLLKIVIYTSLKRESRGLRINFRVSRRQK